VARQGQIVRRLRNADGTMVAKVIGTLGEGIPEQGWAFEGLLALQMHVGQPFRVEFRNVYLKNLP
jgi:hypothetical protein